MAIRPQPTRLPRLSGIACAAFDAGRPVPRAASAHPPDAQGSV